MFNQLKPFTKIIVVGSQRSGTRIGARCISESLNLRYVDETEVHTDSLYSLYQLITEDDNFVVQCPAIAHSIHLLGHMNIAVVFMLRDEKDTIASIQRIGWDTTWGRLEEMFYHMYSRSMSLPEKKTHSWFNWQKSMIIDAFEIEYESLSEHPLWIPKEERTNWNFTQTSRNDQEEEV